eukprot:597456-Pelagomonas_calceolata.AAC.3
MDYLMASIMDISARHLSNRYGTTIAGEAGNFFAEYAEGVRSIHHSGNAHLLKSNALLIRLAFRP